MVFLLSQHAKKKLADHIVGHIMSAKHAATHLHHMLHAHQIRAASSQSSMVDLLGRMQVHDSSPSRTGAGTKAPGADDTRLMSSLTDRGMGSFGDLLVAKGMARLTTSKIVAHHAVEKL